MTNTIKISTIEHKTTIIDAISSYGKSFTALDIRAYIAKNETNETTFSRDGLNDYFEGLTRKGFLMTKGMHPEGLTIYSINSGD